jgi:hypothetical protein
MDKREEGLLEIYARIKAAKDAETLVVKSFQRNPTVPVDLADLPCIFMVEGEDEIVKRSSRNPFGYPAERVLEVVLELIVEGTADIRKLYKDLRIAVLKDGAIVATNTLIREIRTEGPTGYGITRCFRH